MNAQVSVINTLDKYIAESRDRLKRILQRLEWDVEKTLQLKLAKRCDRQNEDFPIQVEPELPPSCATSNSIITGVEKLRQIVKDPIKDVPKRFSDLQLNFSRHQKLAIYEHVVANTLKCTEPEITVPALGENALTFAEIVARKKRASKKRRRYRQSKPTHTEEVRAVVDLQMQALQQYLSTKEQLQHKRETKIYKEVRRNKSETKICKGEWQELQQSFEKKVDHKLKAETCYSEPYRHDIKCRDEKLYQRRCRDPGKRYSRRSRSKSHDRRGTKSTRHRSHSSSRNNKQERVRSRSRERKHHRYRSRSRERKCHKYHSRSPSREKRCHKYRSRSRSRDKMKHYNSGRLDRGRSRQQSSSRGSRSGERSFSRRSRSRSHIRRNTSRRKTYDHRKVSDAL